MFTVCLIHLHVCYANYRANLKLPENLHPKSLVAKHVHVPNAGILGNFGICNVVFLHDVAFSSDIVNY